MIGIWIAFIAFVLLMLALDLGVFHRKAHVVGFREALGWSAVWVGIALAFAVFVYFAYDGQWFGLGTAVDPVDGFAPDGRRLSV
jgi:tellurite resistance protein TerC